jgi:hypothetical protein
VVAAFHPELSGDARFHQMFLDIVEDATLQPARVDEPAPEHQR